MGMSEETTEGIPSTTVADLVTTEEVVTMGSTSEEQPDTTETVEEETTDANSEEHYTTEGIPEQNESTSEEEVVNTTIAAGLLTNPGEDDPEGAFQDETTPDKITEDEMMDQANNIHDILPEEETTRNDKESTEIDEVTTQASSNVIMTHTYVVKERENSSLTETGDISTEIPKPDAAVPNLLDFVNQNFNEADNIIFDTNEIVPLKAPEDGIQEKRTFYRTEK